MSTEDGGPVVAVHRCIPISNKHRGRFSFIVAASFQPRWTCLLYTYEFLESKFVEQYDKEFYFFTESQILNQDCREKLKISISNYICHRQMRFFKEQR